MRTVFMGTGDIAIPSFRALLNHVEVVALVTQPDRPAGRQLAVKSPHIKMVAEDQGIPVLQPESLKTRDTVDAIASLNPELIVVFSYGQILPEDILTMAPMGCINVHASLLPRHRGASCIQSAIRHGDTSTGVTIMHMVKQLDAGDIIKTSSLPLMGQETADLVHNALAELAPSVLVDAIHAIASGTAQRTPQNVALATYAPKLLRKDGQIDWNTPAESIERMIRGYEPWPGTYTMFKDKRGRIKHIKIFPRATVNKKTFEAAPGTIISVSESGILVACASGSLMLTSLQIEGSKKLPYKLFYPGNPLLKGMRLLSQEKPAL